MKIHFTIRSKEIKFCSRLLQGARCSKVVKALCSKPEVRWFDTRWGDFFKFA
jgi:hypothetical protein